MSLLPDLTVVVTTFRRPKRLQKCLQSLVDSGVRDVVVAGSSSGTREVNICKKFGKSLNVTPTLIAHDNGNTECWLRGVTYARSKYVLILHDDDWVLPEFGQVYKKEIHPQLERGVGFATWRGQVVSDIGEIDAEVGCLRGPTRVAGTASVTKAISNPKVTSPSPVISVFRREVCIRTLREAELMMTEQKHFTRPKMRVGEDLLLYYRHAELFDQWLFVDKILTCYGGWHGSETAKHQAPKKLSKLLACYEAARDHFRRVRAHQVPPTPKFFHVYTHFTPKNKEDRRRQEFAQATWNQFSAYGEMYPIPVFDGMFARNTKNTIGDVREMSFLRDMLDHAASFALEEDYILLTNADIGFVPGMLDRIRHEFNTGVDCAFAWRRNFRHQLGYPPKDLRIGDEDGGVDAVVFRTPFWKRHRETFPDMALGLEEWDNVYRNLVAEFTGRDGLHDIIFHEYHAPKWREPEIRAVNPGQKYNRAVSRNFFHRRGQFNTIIKESGWKQ